MSETTPQFGGAAIELPASAPMIRITAGLGSAGQKTWNVRRPVTLIGTCRPAHIVLHDHDVSKAHCVIVNTGTEVLLKDLHTAHGTTCNKTGVDLVVLKDGDVVTVGNTRIQVAIQIPENNNDDSGCGLEYVDPTRFSQPITVRLDHTDQHWTLEEAVTLIGRHSDAAVRVDHEDISARHAVLFRFAGAPAVFDLGSRTGIGVNGQRCTSAGLASGDRIAIGPCTLSLTWADALDAVQNGSEDKCPEKQAEEPVNPPAQNPDRHGDFLLGLLNDAGEEVLGRQRPASPFAAVAHGEAEGSNTAEDDPGPALVRIEGKLRSLQDNISSSWDRLNSWETQLRADANKLDKQETNLSALEAELEARDAALRGQLHDITRYHEQMTAREQELAEQLAKIQEERDRVAKADTDLAKREAEVTRRADELRNREHVLAQRWARLKSATCPQCGKPIRGASPGSTDK